MTASAIWLKCPECAHTWAPVKLPMEAVAACKALVAAFCPSCGNDSPEMASAADIPTAQQENDMSTDEAPTWNGANYGEPPEVKTVLIDATRADEDSAARSRGPMILRKADPVRPPRQHANFFHAHREAARLAKLNPGAEFIISEEIARVVYVPEVSE